MLGGSAAYRLAKTSSLAFFSHLSPLHSSVALLSSAVSPLVGLLAEVPVYEGLHRGLLKLMGHDETGSLAEGLRTSFFNFASLKAFARLGAGQHFLLRRLSQDLGMVLGNDLTASLGWTARQEGSYVKRLLQAEAMSFSMEAGMGLVQGFIGARFFRQAPSFRSGSLLKEVRLRSFAADGGLASISPHLRNRVFIMDSLAKIDSKSFKPGIEASRLRTYRETLVAMRDFQIPFLEGRRRLMEILREDWIDKCEAVGGQVRKIRLDDYLGLLRRANHPVPEWMDKFVSENEANASLKVISVTRSDKRHMTHEEASQQFQKEEYLGFNFGASTDLRMIAQPLGLAEASLREFIFDASQAKPVLNVRRFYLPEELILESGRRAHSHPPANLHTYLEFCEMDELDQSRSEDAWVFQLTPEANIEFHKSVFHPYIALIHDLHIHWNFLNTFSPAERRQQYRAFKRLNALPIHERRLWISDNDLGQVLEGVTSFSIVEEIFSKYLPLD